MTLVGIYGCTPTSDRDADFFAHIYSEDIDKIKQYLNDFPEIDVNTVDSNINVTPLQWAAYNRNSEIVAILLQHGADPDLADRNNGGTLLHWKSLNGESEIVGLLLQHGADPNSSHPIMGRPLHLAARNDEKHYQEIVKMLVQSGANVNAKSDEGGFTPAMIASEFGSISILKILVESGADITLHDSSGKSVKNHGDNAKVNRTEVVEYLQSI